MIGMKNKRIEAINIRLNVAELDFVKTKAAAVNMTISEYIRNEVIKIKISAEAQEERSTPEAVLTIQEQIEAEIKAKFIKNSDSKRTVNCKTRTDGAKGFKRNGKSGMKIR